MPLEIPRYTVLEIANFYQQWLSKTAISNIFLSMIKASTLCALPAVAEKGHGAHGTASACTQS
jgi:hypothetical protein